MQNAYLNRAGLGSHYLRACHCDDQQQGGYIHLSTFHRSTPSIVGKLHLDLQADSKTPGISVHGREVRLLVERHYPRIEILDDVVEIKFGGFLIEWNIRLRYASAEAGLGILAEKFEFARSDWLGKEITCECIGSFIRGVVWAVSAQSVVVGELAFKRHYSAIGKFPLDEKVGTGRFVYWLSAYQGGLSLHGSADCEQIFSAVIRTVQVIAFFRIP